MNDDLIVIIVSLIFSAFFCGMEIAFVSSNRLRFEIDKQKKTFLSSILNIYYSRPDRYISTILVGQNVCMVIYGIKMADYLLGVLAPIGNSVAIAILQTIISTVVLLLLGEFMPKMIFRANPNMSMNIFAVPLLPIYILIYPLSRLNTFLSHWIMGLFGFKAEQDKEILPGRVDLDYLLQESVSAPDDKVEQGVKIFHNALDFSKVKLRNCMVPRTDIVAVEYDSTLEDLSEAFVSSGCSKVVVYKDNIDNIIGYFHSLELFKPNQKWQDKIILMPIVPETMAANKLMNTLLLKKKSLAVVVDEFGGTAGLVSLEDIVEEIFGEIEDEHDTQEFVSKKVKDGEYLFSGRIEIDSINEDFGLGLPVSDDYNTVAGMLMWQSQGIPKTGDVIKIGDYSIEILKAEANRVDLVKLVEN